MKKSVSQASTNFSKSPKNLSRSNSREKSENFRKFKGKRLVDFDEFFEVMSEHYEKKKKSFRNVVYESQITDVSCLFCPYPTGTAIEKDMGEIKVRTKNVG